MKDYLGGGGETALKAAYSLGRQALEQGIGVLDIATAHHEALALLPRKTGVIKQAGEFMAECLSPFEMAQRGFRDSIAALNSLNNMLESEVEKRTNAMRVSEERYRTLIQVSPDAIMVSDLQGKVILCNQQAAQLRGYSAPEEIIGCDSYDFIAPEDLPRVREFSGKVLPLNTIGSLEYTLLRRDGTRVPVETRAKLLLDAEGRPSEMLGVNRDISERKNAQLKLEAQARSQAAVALLGQRALSGTPLDILMHEAVNVVTYATNVEFCELLELLPDGKGLVLRDGVGWHDGMVGKAEVKPGADSQAGYTLLTLEPVIVENLTEEKRFRPPALLLEHGITASMTVIIHGKNQPYGVLGAHTPNKRQFTLDEIHLLQSIANVLAMAIDNWRLLESESRARQKAEKDSEQRLRSLAVISHELRTPLTSIKGFASTLLADDVSWSAASQRDFIQTINDEAEKLSNMISQVLDLSKIDVGAFRFSPRAQRPGELVENARLHLETLAAGHNLIIDVPDDLPDVFADTQHAGQVLENLVGNAAKYSPDGTSISISARKDDKQIIISVSDEGPGIPSSERDKVFQPFYRIQDRNVSRINGVGLGLAICQRLVNAQGGRIWVDENEKHGAVISFSLPLAEAAKQ